MDDSTEHPSTPQEDRALPELSPNEKRLEDLRWLQLQDECRISEMAAVGYAKASKWTQDRAFDGAEPYRRRARHECGITQSEGLAERRFGELAKKYEPAWDPRTGYEVRMRQLEALRERVTGEVASLWAGSDQTKQYFERICLPSVRMRLLICLDNHKRGAISAEAWDRIRRSS